jgi:hypothetical protein
MSECTREAELLEAAHSGLWPEELSAHATQCPACQELAAVMGLLLAAPSPATTELPSAGFLWWKGQLQAQRERTERAQRPMAVAEACAVAGVAAALLLLAGTTWTLVALAAAALALPLAWYLRRVYQSE